MSSPSITIDRLSVTYFAGRSNEVRALKDISLEIFPGEYIIFFGPSGCGKSTLLYSIAGLERNIDGDIVIQGKNLSGMRQGELDAFHQRTVGMVFQSYNLISSLTVVQNVALPQVAVEARWKERTQKAQQLLEKFGVGAQAGKLPQDLSGGQQQRVAICRSLMNDPDIIVADEPVGNLDSKSSKDVMDLLRLLNDQERKTVILVTHDPSHLHHAHRVFYIRDGQITNTKTNTEEERRQSLVEAAASSALPGPATLSDWVRTLPGKASEGGAAFHRQAQEILVDVLTGMKVEEIAELEGKVVTLLREGSTGHDVIATYLHKNVKRGGVGLTLQEAKAMSGRLRAVIGQVRRLDKRMRKAPPPSDADEDVPLAMIETRHLRRLLLDDLQVSVATSSAVAALDAMIMERLAGTIGSAAFQRGLTQSIIRGGIGLSVRDARLLSRRLELFAARPSVPPSPPPTQP